MKMKNSKGVQFWTEHLAGVEREGLSLITYAGKHGLRIKTLYHWSSKLKRAGGVKPAPTDSQFVALRVSQAPRVKSELGCVLVVNSTLRLELQSLPSTQWLVALTQSLRGES
jgi:hypothetical protein